MSENTTIRARFTTMIPPTRTFVVNGLKTLDDAQTFAAENNLNLEETKTQPATTFEVSQL